MMLTPPWVRLNAVDLAAISAVEAHEATVWRRCFEAVDRLRQAEGAPMEPSVASIGPATAYGIKGLASRDVNRVIGLGLGGGSDSGDVAAIVTAYRRWGITPFQVEVADVATASLGPKLEQAGLVRHPDLIRVSGRTLDQLPEPEPGPQVQVLDAGHAAQVGALQRRAWGFWEGNDKLDTWFSAVLGGPGFTHFGVFVDGELACTGALYVDGEMGWAGFDATRPRARHRGLRRAISTVRLRRAVELGCRQVHAETYGPLARDRRGWHTLYLKSRWVPRDD